MWSWGLSEARRTTCGIRKKELLAIVFGMEKFETYVHGRKVMVESDHIPLETIFKKVYSPPLNIFSECCSGSRDMTSTSRTRKVHSSSWTDALSRAFLSDSEVLRGSSDTLLSTMLDLPPKSLPNRTTCRSICQLNKKHFRESVQTCT